MRRGDLHGRRRHSGDGDELQLLALLGRKGFLLAFVPIDRFRLTGGADKLKSYQFHKHNIDHQFCTGCGCQGFAVGTGPGGAKMAAVNLRCVPAADLDALTIQKVDGASF